ncbi:hypothetical protein HF086_002431 [Spodoptera exigua]|uniref:EF-hand domain-containing protein n=1 Tax=Spodoptera exigua TaxID=7107 RepID=A0A922MG30_SPOEX|nr:hypothetical protein HF086_002431 [Spodoptera exigua]
MSLINWKKVENEAGYPCYIEYVKLSQLNEVSGKQQYDHPEFRKIMESLEEYDGIKYNAYRVAFKIYALQKNLRVPPLRISSGVFARHQLSLSESSLSLDTVELDERKEPVRVLAAKTLLIILSEESASDKWGALANCCMDHNGCVSPKRLAALLAHVTALSGYLGVMCDHAQADVEACFDKSAGMLGVSARAVSEWGVQSCSSARWLPVVQRVVASRNSANVLKFKCSKCSDIYFCEKCYLYDKDLTTVSGHKKTHLVHEIMDGQTKTSECINFIKGMKRLFFCTKTKKKGPKKGVKKAIDNVDSGTVRRRKDGRPVIFTSTVGKASGNNGNNPAVVLNDIITQLETQHKSLQELSSRLDRLYGNEADVKNSDNNELRTKENLSSSQTIIAPENAPKIDKIERPQAFDLFSPIPVLENEKQSKVTDIKSQPRVLSLDSGNFSVVSKPESQNLLTMSGDALKPVVVHATSDSISTVSMNDISNWYNETESIPEKRARSKPRLADTTSHSLSAAEQKFAADIRCVEDSNDKMKELNADLDTVLDRLQQILTNNFAMDDSCFDNTQLRETANEMEGLLGTLIRGVEQRATLNATKGLV